MSKVELLEQIIEDFNKDALIQFYKLSSDKFRAESEDFSDNLPKEDKRFENIEQIGRIEHEKKAQSIAFFVSSVSGEISERDSKKKQYDIGKKILRDNYLDAGIFVFYGKNNFRLSLIAASYSGPKRKFTTFKRYTYFVSPELTNKTFKDQLKKCDFSSVERILESFSIEAVNKDFYTQIAEKFTALTGGWRKKGSKKIEKKARMELPDTTDETVHKEFAVRLIGRLIFCWFLKKKTSAKNIPLIPEDILSSKAVERNKVVGRYYHGVLEPLFFELLNTPQDKRKKEYKKEPWSLIPFLNGGLFTPHESDFYELSVDGKSKHINTLIIPDDWLKELLEIYERYNFTIDENTPVDIELSIEPEMLGRIFENLLAEINPQTSETVRKSTGSYYTPRAIVEYMVDESLKQYLISKTGIKEGNIVSLLSYAEDDISKLKADKAEALIKALHDVRIIDPACGSGAFPIGILQKILLILQKLDPDSKKWLEKMLANIPDPLLRRELKKKIKVPNYLHKLGIIRDCIFGVDIQPIAVEIAKLRCFLSLIVDEIVNDKVENRGIEHLPNLEFKFVCANSLIRLPTTEIGKGKVSINKFGKVQTQESLGQKLMFEASDKIDELKELRELYLTAIPGEKKKIEDRFRKVQLEMSEHNIKMGGQAVQTSKLSQWNPFSDEACDWFDPEWMFGIKDGFDIVIGNPPYDEISDKDDKREFQKSYSDVLSGHYDLYLFFFRKSFDIAKEEGCISFITPHTYLHYPQFKNLRKWIYENSHIIEITNRLSGIFESSVVDNTVILLKLTESNEHDTSKFAIKQIINGLLTDSRAINLNRSEFNADSFDIEAIENKKILENFLVNTDLLGSITESSQGITVYAKVQGDKVNWFREKQEDKDSKSVVRGRDLYKYCLRWSGKYIQYGSWLWCPRDPKYFEREKLFLRQTADSLIGTYVKEPMYCIDSVHSIITSSSHRDYAIKYILAVLNSNLGNYLYKLLITETGKVFAQVKLTFLRKIPIKKISLGEQKPFVALVDKILAKKEKGEDAAAEETQINQMVYKLYGLTNDEIVIVENSFKA